MHLLPRVSLTSAQCAASLLASIAALTLLTPLHGGERADDHAHTALREQLPAADVQLMHLPRTGKVIALWTGDNAEPHYAISTDGRSFQRSGPARYTIHLLHHQFDPLRDPLPQPAASLRAVAEGPPAAPARPRVAGEREPNELYIVQFMTQPLEEYRRDITDAGGTIYKYLANHAYIMRLTPEALRKVEALSYVRWIGVYHPAYRLETHLYTALGDEAIALAPMRYRIQVFERGLGQKTALADFITALGGTVDLMVPGGFILEATLSREQLTEIVRRNEVMFVDRWTPPESDMDLVRIIDGANEVETVAGFTGAGVRGEVQDGNIYASHVEFAGNPPVVRTALSGAQNHGTSTYGIVFSSGSNDSRSRGLLPGAEQGIFSSYNHVSDRYEHTAALLEAPHFAVFQSNSWGGALTTTYNTVSAEMDDILFHFDITILQSQSNTGTRSSRPQAWAKNIVSVGGVRHFNTLNTSQHTWDGSGSIGPAADGRVKPDLTHFYDAIFTTRSGNNYTSSFGGTSAATPITAGHFGLLFEMWHSGIFGNPVDPQASVFDNRPRASTAKALMINAASAYPFSGTAHDLTRMHQGWGRADVRSLYEMRDRLFIVDGTDPLENLQSASYPLHVEEGTPSFRATLVYLDPSGTTSSTRHRINHLALRVDAPDGQVFHGNIGLHSGNESAPGGQPPGIDTVQNVFISNPAAGVWHVSVDAWEIVEDAYPALPGLQAAYALVVSGVIPAGLCAGDLTGSGTVEAADLLVLLSNWGPCAAPCPSDLTGDGNVDLLDLLDLVARWGPCS